MDQIFGFSFRRDAISCISEWETQIWLQVRVLPSKNTFRTEDKGIAVLAQNRINALVLLRNASSASASPGA